MVTLIKTIASALVDHPEAIHIREHQENNTLVYTMTVHEDDMGKVIGKEGRIAKSIRSVLYAAATHQQKRVRLDIQDEW
ncbi:KH domain-containing protein [Aliibacillus thermotolerans]|uniref:RNA-binding protein KhpA n=1 Tax=Aliibacillus thermotolerans TaxID=1834418 RepID=A0ABW0U3T1_9BACI|nr:KH domain-containing protein [Aliibacillus thermotolerans]MDA3130640.1 KH domain-containing protein [Aliibacillus thermotolerans]